MHTYIQEHTHMYTHISMHVHMNTHTHTNTQAAGTCTPAHTHHTYKHEHGWC